MLGPLRARPRVWRTGLLARGAKIAETAWAPVAREGDRWPGGTSNPATVARPHHHAPCPVIYGAAVGALCCDSTLFSLLSQTGQPQPCAAANDGAALRVAKPPARHLPRTQRWGPASGAALVMGHAGSGGATSDRGHGAGGSAARVWCREPSRPGAGPAA